MIKKYFDIKLIFIAVVSAAIYAFAVTNFSVPGNIYPGGYSGISRIINDISEEYFSFVIPYYLIFFSLNTITSIFVYRRIGKKFVIYSVIQFVFVSIFSSFFKPIVSLDNVLLYSIFGGIINGFAVGLALRYNFSTAGFDFLSVYFSAKYNKSIWNYILFVNSIILISAGLIFGWNRALYSIIFQYFNTSIIKLMHQRYTYTTLTIITSLPKEVSDEIQRNIRHGITEIHAHGHFSNEEKTILYTVVNSFQYRNVVDIVLKVDPHAFINVQKTSEIYGNYYQKPLD